MLQMTIEAYSEVADLKKQVCNYYVVYHCFVFVQRNGSCSIEVQGYSEVVDFNKQICILFALYHYSNICFIEQRI